MHVMNAPPTLCQALRVHYSVSGSTCKVGPSPTGHPHFTNEKREVSVVKPPVRDHAANPQPSQDLS